jgi:hypothetical protein
MTTCGLFADNFFGTREKVLFEDVWFECRSGLTGNTEETRSDVNLFFNGFDLLRVGGIKDVQRGKTVEMSERFRQDFRAQTRSTHAEKQQVGESGVPDFRGKVREPPICLALLVNNVEPAKPLVFVFTCPQRSVARPKPRDLPICLPIIERRFYRLP